VVLIVFAVEGYFLKKLILIQRILFIVAETFTVIYILNIRLFGLLLAITSTGYEYLAKNKIESKYTERRSQ